MSNLLFHFDGFTQEELRAYLDWEVQQSFDVSLPSSLRVDAYNQTLPRTSRFDISSGLPEKALEYQQHIDKARLGCLMASGNYEEVAAQGRFDGYYSQPVKQFHSTDEAHVYAMSLALGQASNRALLS